MNANDNNNNALNVKTINHCKRMSLSRTTNKKQKKAKKKQNMLKKVPHTACGILCVVVMNFVNMHVTSVLNRLLIAVKVCGVHGAQKPSSKSRVREAVYNLIRKQLQSTLAAATPPKWYLNQQHFVRVESTLGVLRDVESDHVKTTMQCITFRCVKWATKSSFMNAPATLRLHTQTIAWLPSDNNTRLG